MLRRADGTRRVADNALGAMTLLVATSDPADKDLICQMIVNLINESN